MPRATKQLPPLRTCPQCGAKYRAWKDDGCSVCLQDNGLENRSALAEMAREARLSRRGEVDQESQVDQESNVDRFSQERGQTDLPEGF